jgi:hypothetical protein
MGNLRHSHLAPHDILAAEAEPVATTATAPSVKLHKEADNVSLRYESEVAFDHPSSSAPRNNDNVTLRPESDVAPGQHNQEEILKLINSTVSSLHPRDAHKLGAFIHVGKTGGSTLSHHLSWGCHSFVKKPCPGKTIDHETIASKTTTYYHTPDFDRLLDDSKRFLYKFYVFSIRDPFERSVSAYLYQHPENVAARKQQGEHVYNYDRSQKVANQIYQCFPTLEMYTKLLNNFTDWSDDPIHWNPKLLNNTDCAAFAKSTLRHGALHLPKHLGLHLSYDIRAFAGNIHNLNNSSILLVRTEFLWRDWESANRWLGGKGEILSGPTGRNSSSFELPISKQMSDSGRRNLCVALKDEYNLYLRLLGRAANLSEREKLESLEIAQRNCPELKLKL